jgi:hypothetical protein
MKEQFIDNTILRILFFLYPHDLCNFKICLIKGTIQTHTNKQNYKHRDKKKKKEQTI